MTDSTRFLVALGLALALRASTASSGVPSPDMDQASNSKHLACVVGGVVETPLSPDVAEVSCAKAPCPLVLPLKPNGEPLLMSETVFEEPPPVEEFKQDLDDPSVCKVTVRNVQHRPSLVVAYDEVVAHKADDSADCGNSGKMPVPTHARRIRVESS